MTCLFPLAGMTLNLGAALVYLWYGDYARATYWLAACTLTYCVVFWVR